jgi:glycosyltransferase involved in cell wall biosynthesis
VVIVTRDRPRLLADALRGVERQTTPPLEIRIADDGQPPLEELPEIRGLEVTLVHTFGAGPAVARNAAARGARGAVLAFLDDDDRWRPEHLEGLAAAFADPELDFAWRDCEIVRERLDESERVALESVTIECDWDDGLVRENDYLPPSGWGVRRVLFERLGGFDESFARSEDWDFVLRAAATTRPRRVPGVTVEVRLRESGHASAVDDPERRACLDRLAARHGLPPLEPRTFWEVARLAARGAPAARPAAAPDRSAP